jgi:type I restriction enzyme S subunit
LQKSSAKIIPKNSIILSTRAPIGYIAINTLEMATNQGCRGIIPSNKIIEKYLFYFLRNSVNLLNDLGVGTTFKELSTKALASVQIPVPSLPEQKRIVAILDRTFKAIDQAKTNTDQNLRIK